jgi:hypothetical protein
MEEIVKNFEKEFEKLRKELKLKITLDELDEEFHVRDYILKEGFISNKLSKQICRRIVDVLGSWLQYLHGTLMPNPNSLVSMAANQAFNEEDKQEVNMLINKLMTFSTGYNLLVLKDDKKLEQEFIDNAVTFTAKEMTPLLIKFITKEDIFWKNRSNKKKESPKKENKNKDSMYG